jgi:hypothetical protein
MQQQQGSCFWTFAPRWVDNLAGCCFHETSTHFSTPPFPPNSTETTFKQHQTRSNDSSNLKPFQTTAAWTPDCFVQPAFISPSTRTTWLTFLFGTPVSTGAESLQRQRRRPTFRLRPEVLQCISAVGRCAEAVLQWLSIVAGDEAGQEHRSAED